MRGWSASGLRKVGGCPASALEPLAPFSMGENERGAGDCGGAKRTVPRVAPGFGKTEVRRELRPGVRKRLLPVCLGMLDGSFEVAGTRCNFDRRARFSFSRSD
jgi:hypothetical protein